MVYYNIHMLLEYIYNLIHWDVHCVCTFVVHTLCRGSSIFEWRSLWSIYSSLNMSSTVFNCCFLNSDSLLFLICSCSSRWWLPKFLLWTLLLLCWWIEFCSFSWEKEPWGCLPELWCQQSPRATAALSNLAILERTAGRDVCNTHRRSEMDRRDI